MKIRSLLIIPLLLVSAFAQPPDETRPTGVIYEVAIGQDGQPAKGIGLTARQRGFFVVGGILPHVRTNEAKEYRFENLQLGRYTVSADDEDTGYALFATGPSARDAEIPEVELTAEHHEAEWLVQLPPRAGFLTIELTTQKTGAVIPAMRVPVTQADEQRAVVFTMSCYSDHVVLIPPDRDLLLHISSGGFREWQESVGAGKPVHLSSGARLKLDVQLAPLSE